MNVGLLVFILIIPIVFLIHVLRINVQHSLRPLIIQDFGCRLAGFVLLIEFRELDPASQKPADGELVPDYEVSSLHSFICLLHCIHMLVELGHNGA